MRTWDDVKYLYYSIAKKVVENYRDFLRLYEINDLVNDVYILTYPFINEDKQKLSLRIYQVTKNMVFRFYRKQYRGKGARLNNAVKINFNPINNMDFQDEDIDHTEIRDFIIERVQILTLEERIILFLRYFCNWTESAIGKLFGVEFQGIKYDIPSNVISYRLKCVYDKLRTCETGISYETS